MKTKEFGPRERGASLVPPLDPLLNICYCLIHNEHLQVISTQSQTVADPGFPRGGGANLGGHRHMILPNFLENCIGGCYLWQWLSISGSKGPIFFHFHTHLGFVSPWGKSLICHCYQLWIQDYLNGGRQPRRWEHNLSFLPKKWEMRKTNWTGGRGGSGGRGGRGGMVGRGGVFRFTTGYYRLAPTRYMKSTQFCFIKEIVQW